MCDPQRGNYAGGRTMANFTVSLKKLTEKVSMDVVLLQVSTFWKRT